MFHSGTELKKKSVCLLHFGCIFSPTGYKCFNKVFNGEALKHFNVWSFHKLILIIVEFFHLVHEIKVKLFVVYFIKSETSDIIVNAIVNSL